MSEKLLNESTIRRFMKLANLSPLSSEFLTEVKCKPGTGGYFDGKTVPCTPVGQERVETPKPGPDAKTKTIVGGDETSVTVTDKGGKTVRKYGKKDGKEYDTGKSDALKAKEAKAKEAKGGKGAKKKLTTREKHKADVAKNCKPGTGGVFKGKSVPCAPVGQPTTTSVSGEQIGPTTSHPGDTSTVTTTKPDGSKTVIKRKKGKQVKRTETPAPKKKNESVDPLSEQEYVPVGTKAQKGSEGVEDEDAQMSYEKPARGRVYYDKEGEEKGVEDPEQGMSYKWGDNPKLKQKQKRMWYPQRAQLKYDAKKAKAAAKNESVFNSDYILQETLKRVILNLKGSKK